MLEAHRGHHLLNRQLSNWAALDRTGLPKTILRSSVQDILELPVPAIAESLGNAPDKVRSLVELLAFVRWNIEKSLGHVRPSRNSKPGLPAHDAGEPKLSSEPEKRFLSLQSFFNRNANHRLLGMKISRWVSRQDRDFPHAFIDWQIRRFTRTTLDQIRGPHSNGAIGNSGIQKLLEVLDDARAEIEKTGHVVPQPSRDKESRAGNTPELEPTREIASAPQGSVSEDTWKVWVGIVSVHHLGHYPLGRLAATLRYFPRSLWEVKVRDYAALSLAEISATSGHGPTRLRLVLDVFRLLARSFEAFPTDSHLKVCTMSAAIRDVSSWIESSIIERRVPDVSEVKCCLLDPLLSQLDNDLGPETREMVERRIGLSEPRQSMEEIGRAFGVSAGRIAQLTERPKDVFNVRWAESRFVLDNLCDLFLKANAVAQLGVLRLVMNELLGLDYEGDRTATIRELRRRLAGQSSQSPSSEDTVRRWLKSVSGTLPSRNNGHGLTSERMESRIEEHVPQIGKDGDRDLDDLVKKIVGLL